MRSVSEIRTPSEAELLESVEHYKALSEQLQHALESRIAIEQAKGVLSERYQVDVDQAFTMLRRFCRSNNLKLADAARAVTTKPAGHKAREAVA